MKSLIAKVVMGTALIASMMTFAGPASAAEQAPSGSEPGTTILSPDKAPKPGTKYKTLEGDTIVIPEPRMQAQSGTVCAGAEGPAGTTVCIYADGSGTYVNYARVFTNHANSTQHCGVQGASWGTTPSGQPSVTRYSAFDYGCFILQTPSGNITMYRTFQNGSLLYGNQYYDGAWRGGIVGIGIRA